MVKACLCFKNIILFLRALKEYFFSYKHYYVFNTATLEYYLLAYKHYT